MTGNLSQEILTDPLNALLDGVFATAAAADSPYDAVVDAAGGGDYATLAAAEAALTAPFYVWVKDGSYTGTTLAKAGKWFFEGGCTVTSALAVSGDKVALELGPDCDIQALYTHSGDDGHFVGWNGIDLDGITASGARYALSGGGWGTISDGGTTTYGLTVSDADGLAEAFTAQTTTGSTGENAVEGGNSSTRLLLQHIKVVDSEEDGLHLRGLNTAALGCLVQGADTEGVSLVGTRSRLLGNGLASMGNDGIAVSGGGTDSVMVGNVIKDPTGDSVELAASADDCVVVGNRLDGVANDGSTGSTVGSNDETAF